MWVDKQRKEREIRGWRQLCTRTCWVEGWGGGGILPQKMSCRKTRLGEMHRRQHTWGSSTGQRKQASIRKAERQQTWLSLRTPGQQRSHSGPLQHYYSEHKPNYFGLCQGTRVGPKDGQEPAGCRKRWQEHIKILHITACQTHARPSTMED